MADSTTGGLPAVKVKTLPSVADIYDEFLMPGEFQGQAVHVNGKQMKDYAIKGAEDAVKPFVDEAKEAARDAKGSAQQAANSAKQAGDSASASAGSANAAAGSAQQAAQSAREAANSADGAEKAKRYIEDMTASARTIEAGKQATVTKTNTGTSFNLDFGIPKGDKGDKGDTGNAAGFGEITATVDNTTGNPKVAVTQSGTNEAQNIKFEFTGLKGERGIQGEQGEPGRNAVVVETEGMWVFQIEEGHLFCYYTGDTAPNLEIDDTDGHLYWNIA